MKHLAVPTSMSSLELITNVNVREVAAALHLVTPLLLEVQMSANIEQESRRADESIGICDVQRYTVNENRNWQKSLEGTSSAKEGFIKI